LVDPFGTPLHEEFACVPDGVEPEVGLSVREIRNKNISI